jgi:LuxR family maltose regulon positive regulatory protein
MHDADLAVAIAGASLYGGQVKDAAAYIELAQDLASTVPEERRWRFDLGVGATRLSLARRRADVEAALEAMGLVEDGLAAQPASELGRGSEYRSAALMNLGIAELWALRTTDALRHLEEALALARRLDRPCLEIGCLSYLALARPLAGESLQDGLRLAEQAIEVAETHGWAFDAISAPAFAIAGLELVWLGRLDEAGRLLARADDLLIADSEPVLELAVRYASGLVRFAEGRLEEALAAFREAESMSALLSHDVLTIDPKAWTLQVQALLGDGEPARAALSELTDEERDRSGMRIADTAIHLAQQQPAQAVEALVPLIERRGHAVEQPCVAVTALLFEAAAHDKLCERNAAETSLERALELAEPDGILLPFLVAPVRGLLERHPRHRTAHATLLATVLDLLGGSPRSLNGRPPPALEELSEAELRVLRYLAGNLKAPEIASELCVSPNTVRTHLRHIYAKLGAHSRSEAVTRARELRLLGFSTTRH